jgi:hypothetical protein
MNGFGSLPPHFSPLFFLHNPLGGEDIHASIRLFLTANPNETMTDEAIQSHYGPDVVLATIVKEGTMYEYKLSNVPVSEKLEKFMEDVK